MYVVEHEIIRAEASDLSVRQRSAAPTQVPILLEKTMAGTNRSTDHEVDGHHGQNATANSTTRANDEYMHRAETLQATLIDSNNMKPKTPPPHAAFNGAKSPYCMFDIDNEGDKSSTHVGVLTPEKRKRKRDIDGEVDDEAGDDVALEAHSSDLAMDIVNDEWLEQMKGLKKEKGKDNAFKTKKRREEDQQTRALPLSPHPRTAISRSPLEDVRNSPPPRDVFFEPTAAQIGWFARICDLVLDVDPDALRAFISDGSVG
ncbi:hypothetical protein C7974DRAFT_380832 [Boeremia exigua]|uniref:uncharacterized protein n=1 Tax=Boeremia exigua TaxID=749465 RepID=UPI001E8C9F39|nr:uncharacterized protein C7974DRAFT_380832 [Boeremia exigua]KAH6613119.1 hypothetical protein C7974DRAFT_380832 [Boeremia exigua]